MTARVLLLAGTSEARDIAHMLADREEWRVIASLAGATETPRPLPVETRYGGFGGADGLVRYLREIGIDAVIDATHPFARRMTANAAAACRALDIPLLRVERPQWDPPAGAQWIGVASLEEAAAALPAGARAFLTVGANGVAPFAGRTDVWFLVRTMEDAGALPLANHQAVSGAPPADSDEEIRLMKRHGITHLVTKNAGGPASAKLDAAARLSIPAIVIERPETSDAETVHHPCSVVDWLQRTLTQS